jgi:23S rRNA (adenine1618-N6)-methyltransferase
MMPLLENYFFKGHFSMAKEMLHPRSKHRERYDFEGLKKALPELSSFIVKNKFNGEDTIDFSNSKAVKGLNKALLMSCYGISFWDIPEHYLCPPIPGRADYIHFAADLLALSNNGKIPTGESVRVLDIGVGANCIYPIIGHQEYGWSFVGSEIHASSIDSAQNIINGNPTLKDSVTLRFQSNPSLIFKGVINPDERFDLILCNPPFHESLNDAKEVSDRKNQSLGLKRSDKPKLNFGGQSNELWCRGGEVQFIRQMVLESRDFKENCKWFTTLVSKKENLSGVYGEIKRVGASTVKTFEMSQGQKISRFVAWTFLDIK